MNSILQGIADKGALVSDGAWGTMLMRAGFKAGECAELWNVERPDVVRDIASAYYAAGSDIAMTNSFGGSRIMLASHGLSDRAAELNEAAAALSREAAGPDRYVLASLGPTGKILMMGEVSEQEVYDAFAEQAVALETGGADAVSVETMAAIDEGVIGVRAVKENTRLECLSSFTYNVVGDQANTMMGATPEDVAAAVVEAGADMLGVNCTLGPEEMRGVVKRLYDAAPDLPILVHPNAGQPETDDQGNLSYPVTPDELAACVPGFIEAGAKIIGGCCGTTPDHISAVANAVAAWRVNR